MTLISSYNNDTTPSLSDKLLGTDGTNGGTINILVEDVLKLINGVSGKDYIQYKFSLTNHSNEGYFNTNESKTNPAEISKFFFNKQSTTKEDLTVLFTKLDTLQNIVISLRNPENTNNFATFKITNITINTTYFVFDVVLYKNFYSGDLVVGTIYSAYFDVKENFEDKTDKGGYEGTAQDLDDAKQNISQKGIADGYASLDVNGLVPASQLPSYVDDVLEFTNLAAFPVTGATGKIYIAIDSSLIYRWSGTIYIEIKDTSAVWGAITGTVTNQTDLINWINLNVVTAPFLGTVAPASTPTGTGSAYWIATQNGTYTNFGGVVVAANSFAVISRNAGGAFSISQTTLDITSKVNVSDVINTLASTETAKPLSANQGKVLNGKITDLINVVGTEVTITPSATTTGYITNTGTINTSFANYFHKTYPISDLNKLHYASSYLVGSGISIIHFFKANGDYLGYQNLISANTTILNELIIFPLLTASIKINYTGTANVNLKYIELIKIDVINTLVSTETAKPLSANQGRVLDLKIVATENALLKKTNVTQSSTNAGFVNKSGVIVTLYAGYSHKNYSVANINNKHFFSTTSDGTDLALIHFFKADGTYLGNQNTVNALTTVTDELIVFPALTAVVKINYKNSPTVNLNFTELSNFQAEVGVLNTKIDLVNAADVQAAKTVLSENNAITSSTTQSGGFINNSGNFSASATYRVENYLIADITKKHFYTTYFGGSGLSLLHFYGAADVYLGSQNPIVANTQLTNEPIVFPVGTVKIKVNSALASVQGVVYTDYIPLAADLNSLSNRLTVVEQKSPKSTIEFTKETSQFSVRTAFDSTRDLVMVYFVNVGNKNVSQNGTYIGLNTLTTAQIKATAKAHDTADSVAPFQTKNYWFINGEHGYLIPKIVSTGHNKVVADLGSMWQCADGKQFKLIKISGNDLYFAPKITINGGGAGKDTSDYVYGYVMTALTHVSGATNTGNITVTTNSSFQWKPINDNIKKTFFCDGKEIVDNGVYNCLELVVKDVHECYNPATITQFEPTFTADKWFRTTYTYKFIGMSCAVNHSIELFSPLWLEYYGATQPMGLTKSGDKDSFIFIPKVQSKTSGGVTTDWKQPQNCSVADQVWGATSFAVTANDLIDVNKVPDRIVQYHKNPSGDYLLGFASGLSLLSSNTRDSIRKNKMQSVAFSFKNDYRNKMYFRVITALGEEGDLLPTGWVANYNYYHTYYNPALSPAKVYWYKENNSFIVYIHCFEIINNCKIILPDFMEGKVAEIVEKTTDASLITDTIVANEIYVKFTSALANYIVLKF